MLPVTRASEILIIIDSEKNGRLPFLKMTYEDIKKDKYVAFEGSTDTSEQSTPKDTPISRSVTDIVKYLPVFDYKHLFHAITKDDITEININNTICTNNDKELIRDLIHNVVLLNTTDEWNWYYISV